MNESILVIEDDKNMRKLVAEILEDEGYEVFASRDPDQAIATARVRKFQLALSDVRMAGTTDGIGALEVIKKLQPRIRTIVMTGFASEDAPVRAALISADDYLLKADSHFGAEGLLRVIRNVLEREEREPPGWWEQVLAWPGRVARRPAQAALMARLPQLEEHRQRLFSSLFVLMRSDHIDQDFFWQFWQRLQTLETVYLSLSRAEEVAPVEQRYASFTQDLLAKRLPPDEPGTLNLTQAQVNELFERVRQGLVEAWQFGQAAVLWISETARRESVASYVLFHILWGPRLEVDPAFFIGKTLGQSCRVHIRKRLASVGDVQRFNGSLEGSPQTVVVEMVRSTALADGLRAKAASESEVLGVEQVESYLMVVRAVREKVDTLEYQLREECPCGRAFDLLKDVFREVIANHGKGIYDGCLGPHRIIFTSFGGRLADFGPERFHNLMSDDPELNRVSFAEIAHVAPEIRGAPESSGAPNASVLSGSADQYCLGSIFTQVLLGLPSRQFLGRLLEAPRSPLGGPDFKLRERNADWGKVEPILQRMTATLARQRFPTLEQARRAIAEVAEVPQG